MNVSNTILLSSADNVAVANGRIEIGTALPGGALATAVIEPGHKVAIKPIAAGEAVVKYAQAIGRATQDIAPGEHGASIDNNPSPGNKRGGLTTILEKSLGAVAKGGQTPLNGVFGYAEKVTGSGLVFMGREIFELIVETASGRKTKSEDFGYGDNEFVPWHLGATL